MLTRSLVDLPSPWGDPPERRYVPLDRNLGQLRMLAWATAFLEVLAILVADARIG
jgi:hypothetical protein